MPLELKKSAKRDLSARRVQKPADDVAPYGVLVVERHFHRQHRRVFGQARQIGVVAHARHILLGRDQHQLFLRRDFEQFVGFLFGEAVMIGKAARLADDMPLSFQRREELVRIADAAESRARCGRETGRPSRASAVRRPYRIGMLRDCARIFSGMCVRAPCGRRTEPRRHCAVASAASAQRASRKHPAVAGAAFAVDHQQRKVLGAATDSEIRRPSR